MIETSLREFLTSGVFGPITATTAASEAVALLPEPDSVYETSTGRILTFDTIELHVLEGSRCFVYGEYNASRGFSAGSHIRLDPWFFCTEQQITLGLVAEMLTGAGIDYTIEQPNLTLDMVLDSGVTLHFENIDDTPNLPDTKHHFIAFSYPLNQGPR